MDPTEHTTKACLGRERSTEDSPERYASPLPTRSGTGPLTSIQHENVHISHQFLLPLYPSPNPPLPDRSKRVKDAKSEAQKEIEEYRKQKDDDFKEFEKKACLLTTLTRLGS